jgi:hypothetical protein
LLRTSKDLDIQHHMCSSFLFIIVHNQQLIPQAGEAKYNYYTPGALRHTS